MNYSLLTFVVLTIFLTLCITNSGVYCQSALQCTLDYTELLLNSTMTPQCGCNLGSPLQLGSTCYANTQPLYLNIVDQNIYNHCDYHGVCDRIQSVPVANGATYDFIVVGSGISGCAMAALIVNASMGTVLVIEQGIDPPPFHCTPSFFTNLVDSKYDLRYETIPQGTIGSCSNGCILHAGNGTGGGSVLSSMLYLRGPEAEYNEHARVTQDNSLLYANIEQYFEQVESGPIKINNFDYTEPQVYKLLQASATLGYPTHDLNGYNGEGAMIGNFTTNKYLHWPVPRAFLDPIRNHPNITYHNNAQVTKVLLSSNTATGVEITYSDGTKKILNAQKEVILGAGVIGTPRILSLSGIGPASVLNDVEIPIVMDLPGVGKHMYNRDWFPLFCYTSLPSRTWLDAPIVKQFLKAKTGMMSTAGTPVFVLKIATSQANLGYANVIVHVSLNTAQCARVGACDERESLLANQRFIFWISILYPTSNGYVKLVSKDPKVKPNIYADSFTNPVQIAIVKEAITELRALMQTAPLTDLDITVNKSAYPGCNVNLSDDAFWTCAIKGFGTPHNHASGTCQMSNNSADIDAVVNTVGQVKNISKLRIVDASILPNASSSIANNLMTAYRIFDVSMKQLYAP